MMTVEKALGLVVPGTGDSDEISGGVGPVRGQDAVIGGHANDSLAGYEDDGLLVGMGDDMPGAEWGNDTLAGGHGADIFTFIVDGIGMIPDADTSAGDALRLWADVQDLPLHTADFLAVQAQVVNGTIVIPDAMDCTLTLTGVGAGPDLSASPSFW